MNKGASFLREYNIPEPERLTQLILDMAGWTEMICSPIEGWYKPIETIVTKVLVGKNRHLYLTIMPEDWPDDSHLYLVVFLRDGWWLPSNLRIEARHVPLGEDATFRAALEFISEPPQEGDDIVGFLPLPNAPTSAYRCGTQRLAVALGIPHEPSPRKEENE